MKKLLYMMGLTLLLASCSDDYTDWANPVTSEQEASKTVTLTLANAPAIDYATLDDPTVKIFIPTVKSDEEATTTYKAIIYNEDKTQSKTLDCDKDGKVNADDLKAAVESLYGKRPVARVIPITVNAYSNVNGVSVFNTASTTTTITLVAPFIDTAYYMVGDMFGWDLASACQFTQVGTGDVYDNPNFAIVFNTSDVNKYWKITTKTNYDGGDIWVEGPKGVVGVVTNGDVATSGNLTTTAPQAGMIPEAGNYRMVLNMLDYSYTITKITNIGIVGDATGSWDVDTDLTYNDATGAWEATVTLAEGSVKFRMNHGWDISWGGTANDSDFANLTEANGQNLKIAEAGTYNIVLTFNKGGKTSAVFTKVP